jgi:hypothetical protein
MANGRWQMANGRWKDSRPGRLLRTRKESCSKCAILGYSTAWAERAKRAGDPERFAQEALGHNSKAVHRAYAKRALMKIPSLEDYEQRAS